MMPNQTIPVEIRAQISGCDFQNLRVYSRPTQTQRPKECQRQLATSEKEKLTAQWP